MHDDMIAVRGNMAAELMKNVVARENNEARILNNAQREMEAK